MLRINDQAPNFTAETSQGTINFHEWMGNGWAILFSHPKDFTPVCTTEPGYMAELQPEFEKRNCKIKKIKLMLRGCAEIVWHFVTLSWGELCSSMPAVLSGSIGESF
jgi:peroxiredoxin